MFFFSLDRVYTVFLILYWMHSVHNAYTYTYWKTKTTSHTTTPYYLNLNPDLPYDMLIDNKDKNQRKNPLKINSICWIFFIWTMLCPHVHFNNKLLLLLIHKIQCKNIHFSFRTLLNLQIFVCARETLSFFARSVNER